MFLTSRLNLFLTPIKAMRLRYMPLLMIYFAYGASTFSGIAESFFVKEKLNLSAETLLMIGAWLTLPWTIKMVFGQLVDSIRFFGFSRRFYVFFGAGLMASGSVLLAGLAGQWIWVCALGSVKAIYITSSLISIIGVVIQDVVADAMTVEVVPREGRSENEINQELAMVQLLGRISLMLAIFLVAGIGGWLAQILSYQTMFLLNLIAPLISISGILLVKTPEPLLKPINKVILFGGLIYAIFVMIMSFSEIAYHQEIVFFVSLFIVIFFLRRVAGDLDKNALRKIMYAAIVIFLFRAMPMVGPALQWWEIDVLKFNQAFFGTMSQISAGLSILGMWVFAKFITEKPIGLVFVTLTLIGTLLTMPVIAMYYGLHIWTEQHFGFGAHAIALVDVALASPFEQLSMVPMLALAARYAPKGNAATWFALMASLMNLALTAANLMSKELNRIWVVTREIKNAAGHVVMHADYSYLGHLLIITTLLGLIIPILAVLIFLRNDLTLQKYSRAPNSQSN